MAFERRVDACLVEFNAQQTIQYIPLCGGRNLNKRSAEPTIQGLDNPTYLTIANTLIAIDHELDEEVSNIELFESDVDLKCSDTHISVMSKRRSKMNAFTILKAKLQDDQVQRVLGKEIKFLNCNIFNSGVVKLEQKPQLRLTISGKTLHVEIKYLFSLVESLYLTFNSPVASNLTTLLSEYLPQSQESSLEFTSKLFYDTIIENTQGLPKPEMSPFVNGLGADLLPFQGRSVNWLLSKEGMVYDDETHTVKSIPASGQRTIQDRMNELSYGFQLISLPFYSSKVWFNQYSNNICSQSKAEEFVRDLYELKGRGLLSEEMGLGKTVEILSLALLNKRPELATDKQFYFDYSKNKSIRKSKTTLIICPESILEQWVEEIELHSPGLSTMIYKGISKYKDLSLKEIVDMMTSSDVVVTSYGILQREIHNAVYDPSKAKRLRKTTLNPKNMKIKFNTTYFKQEDIDKLDGMYKDLGVNPQQPEHSRDDYTSPLVLIEFWRLVVDEVQMVGQTASNVCKITTLIPRVHSWGVSGTPIKQSINDLASLVNFLGIHPFAENRTSWKKLVENGNRDILNFFKDISLRHTKAMVSDDIKLPSQQKILLSIPFGAVEQNNYDELYKVFLNEVKLDNNGQPTVDDWETSNSYNDKMRNWLKILRRICCHANLGLERRNGDLGYTSFGYETIDTVLNLMIENTRDKITESERNITLRKIDKGLLYEVGGKIKLSLDIWLAEVPVMEETIKNLRALKEESSSEKTMIALRSSLEILHRLYFFIGSAHYQMSSPPIAKLAPGIEDQVLNDISDPHERYYLLYNPDKIDYSNVVVHRALTEEESKHRDLEDKYYAKAQVIRQELLSESMANVADYSARVSNMFELPLSVMIPHKFNSLKTTTFAFRINTIVSQLNAVSQTLNKWVADVGKILSTPLLDSKTDLNSPDGEEYTDSLEEQSNSSVYLEFIQRLLLQRNSLINGTDQFRVEKIRNPQITSLQNELAKRLEEELPDLNLLYSLKYLLIESKAMINEEVVDHEPLTDYVLQIKEIYDSQIKASDEFNKQYRSFNDLYNKKIVYYKQLQQISDNVAFLQRDDFLRADISQLDYIIGKKAEEIASYNSRIRYLESLALTDKEIDTVCVICRSEISVGSLIRCGHKYCKECLQEWLGTYGVKKDCPMCNQTIHPSDIYHFTLNKDVLSANMITLHEDNGATNERELFQVYQKIDEDILDSINSIKIKQNYGSKINTILRQIIWLKNKDPNVQIVIYSQWTQVLQILSKALQQNDIQFLGSGNTLNNKPSGANTSHLSTDIAKFKKETSITCFLLNARADASGLNLINATHVFICEPLVQTALELQAISRIHRIGQTKPTTIWMFSITGSVEESIMLLSTRKKMKEKEKLDTEELSKSSKTLIETNGEVVGNDDLWNAFFSSKLNIIS
jgi:E3 ubiquitin-protein ligase SHPRH